MPPQGTTPLNSSDVTSHMLYTIRDCRSPPPDFDRSDNPRLTRGDKICPQNYYLSPSGFTDLPTALLYTVCPYSEPGLYLMELDFFCDRTECAYNRERHRAGSLNFSSCQQNLIKTYHNEANTPLITKIALKTYLDICSI